MTAPVETVLTVALVVARVSDPAGPVPREVRAVTTTAPHVHARVATGGYVVLAGRPELALPDLATTGGSLAARVLLDDGTTRDVMFAVPPGAVLPWRPPAVAAPFRPIALTGSVSAALAPYGPIAGATVTAVRTLASEVLLTLGLPLAAEHAAGLDVTPRTLAPAAAATTLAAPVRAGDTVVALGSVAGCGGANAALVLGLDAGAEPVRIAAVDAVARTVTLEAPLRRSRPATTTARAHTVMAAGAPWPLTRAAGPGDGVLAVAAALPAGATAADVDGPVPELRPIGARTDAGGRWRLDGVRGTDRLDVTARAAGFQPLTRPYVLDHRRPDDIDLRLTT